MRACFESVDEIAGRVEPVLDGIGVAGFHGGPQVVELAVLDQRLLRLARIHLSPLLHR